MTRHAELRARGIEFWARAAPGWIRYADIHDRIGRPLGAAAFDRLAVQPGERVLDVGCGCGGTTAELAAAAGPRGTAIGIDLSPAMIDAARRRFPARSHPGLHFDTADIETDQEVPGAPFDAVYSRMTLMLLADPIAGLAAIGRLLRPGGRLAATVFRDSAANPWLTAAILGAAPHVGALPPLPLEGEPGPFAFADESKIQRILTAAGFDDINVEPYDVVLPAPDDPGTVAEWLIEIGPAGAAYRATPTTEQATARDGVARLLDRYRTATGYKLPAGIWLITAIKANPEWASEQ